jgi:hypothetical protein
MVMTAAGIDQDRIAACLGDKGISDATMRKHFRRELNIGLDKVNAIAAQSLVKAIQAGEAWAVCFWMKTRMGWREKSAVDHRLVDGEGKDRGLMALFDAAVEAAEAEGA